MIARTLVAFALIWLASSATLLAQRAEKFMLAAGGAYVPTSEGTRVDDGHAASGSLGLEFLPHAWLSGSYSYWWLEGEDESPRWEAQAVAGSLGYDIVPTGMNGNWIFYVGAGAIWFDPEAADLETRSHLVLSGGMKLIYDFSRHLAGSIEAGVSVALADEAQVGGDVWLFPLGLGLTVRF